MNRLITAAVFCLVLATVGAACQPAAMQTAAPSSATVIPTEAEAIRETAVSTSLPSTSTPSPPSVAITSPSPLSEPVATVEACYTTPIRGFGKVWADHPEAQTYVGCPFAVGEKAMNFLAQRFQHGTILWAMGLEYPASAQDQAYVLFEDDGTFVRVPVDWAPQSPSPIPTPMGAAEEPFEPQGKLAEVWREGPRVRDRLGLAVESEVWGTGAWQEFSRGWMFWIPHRQGAPDDAPNRSFENRDRWIYVLAMYWPNPAGSVRNEWLQFLDTWE